MDSRFVVRRKGREGGREEGGREGGKDRGRTECRWAREANWDADMLRGGCGVKLWM
jgi:hypothetical protein